jgi:hypothetical protein
MRRRTKGLRYEGFCFGLSAAATAEVEPPSAQQKHHYDDD